MRPNAALGRTRECVPLARNRHCGEQQLGVLVLGPREQVGAIGFLDYPAEVHHHDAIAERLDHREVVRDEHIGEAEPRLQVLEQAQHLRLHRDVERRDRFVADEDLGFEDDGPSDADPLTLPTRELMRPPIGDLRGIEPDAGTIALEGKPVTGLKGDDKLEFHRKVQMVFQDPLSSLNPRKTVHQILEGPLQVLLGMDKGARAARVEELMRLVSLRPEFVDRYPHEFSRGQCQRIGIARALAAAPGPNCSSSSKIRFRR